MGDFSLPPAITGQWIGAKGGGTEQFRNELNQYLYQLGIDPNDGAAIAAAIKQNKDLVDRGNRYSANQFSRDLDKGAAGYVNTWGGYGKYKTNQDRTTAGQQQQTLLTNQLRTADEFRRNLPQYISEEAGALKKSLSAQLAEARGQIKANENARGMLYSGRRQKSEGQAGLQAQSAYTQGVGDISSAAEKASSAMAANPLKSQANLAEAQQAQNQYLQDAARARKNAAQNLQAGYMGMVGQGVGTYLGGRSSPTQYGGAGSGAGSTRSGASNMMMLPND